MTPEESQIIGDVFARVRTLGPAPRDPDARASVAAELAANPDAAVGLVRMLVMLDRERQQLMAERDQLAAELDAARGAPSGGLFGNPQPSSSTRGMPQSGPWGQPQPAPSPWGQAAPPPVQPSMPWGQPQPQQPGGGFVRSALGAAAGMAGGLFAFEALRNVFGHPGGSMFGPSTTEVIHDTTVIHDQNVNYNPYGTDAPSSSSTGGLFDTSSDDGTSFASGDDDSLFG